MKTKRVFRLVVKVCVWIALLIVPFSWTLTQCALNHVPRAVNWVYTDTPSDVGMTYEDVTIQSSDELTLTGWLIRRDDGVDGTWSVDEVARRDAAVIVVHGYRSNKTAVLDMAVPLYSAGYTVLAIDLRSHGDSSGREITFGIREQEDVDAAVAWLMAHPDVDPERIGVLGESMGGATAILATAGNPHIKAVATQGAFASMRTSISTYISHFLLVSYPIADLMMFFGERQMEVDTDLFAPLNVIEAISPRPVLLMQGGRDHLVNPESGRLLYEAAGEPKELWFEPELKHTNFPNERPEEFGQRIVTFFDESLE